MPSVEPQVATILTEWQRLIAASRDAMIRSRSRIEDSSARVDHSNRRMDRARRLMIRSPRSGTSEP
jgi:hypothetical protein